MQEEERGKLLYSDVRNRKARRVRLMLLASSLLTAVGFAGLAAIVLIFAFVVFPLPLFVQALGALLAGALLYWTFLGIQDFNRFRKGLKPLKVYELRLRLPCGSEDDLEHGRPPRYVSFEEIESFYPNEGKAFPHFAIVLKDLDADPVIVQKEFVGNWGRFRKAVKEKMNVHKDWVFLKEEGPAYAGEVESDDLHLVYGPKEAKVKLSWDDVAKSPSVHTGVTRSLVLMTVSLRKGGKLKFLVPSETAQTAAKSYRKYVDRFWKAPEQEEERWEKIEESGESKEEKT